MARALRILCVSFAFRPPVFLRVKSTPSFACQEITVYLANVSTYGVRAELKPDVLGRVIEGLRRIESRGRAFGLYRRILRENRYLQELGVGGLYLFFSVSLIYQDAKRKDAWKISTVLIYPRLSIGDSSFDNP